MGAARCSIAALAERVNSAAEGASIVAAKFHASPAPAKSLALNVEVSAMAAATSYCAASVTHPRFAEASVSQGSAVAHLSSAAKWGSSAGQPPMLAGAKSIAADALIRRLATKAFANVFPRRAMSRGSNVEVRATDAATQLTVVHVRTTAKSVEEAGRTSAGRSPAFLRHVNLSEQSVGVFLTAAAASSYVPAVCRQRPVEAGEPRTSAAAPRRAARLKARIVEAFPMAVEERSSVALAAANKPVAAAESRTCAAVHPKLVLSSAPNVGWSLAVAVGISTAVAAALLKLVEVAENPTSVAAHPRRALTLALNAGPFRTVAAAR